MGKPGDKNIRRHNQEIFSTSAKILQPVPQSLICTKTAGELQSTKLARMRHFREDFAKCWRQEEGDGFADVFEPNYNNVSSIEPRMKLMSRPAPRARIERDAVTGMPLRKVTLMVPDARDPQVLARAKKAVTELNADDEADAIAFIEAVSDYDADGLLKSE